MHKQLSIQEWTLRAQKHKDLMLPYTDGFVKRRSMGVKEPVLDFLFVYYTFSPLKLKQWVPSFEESLEFSENLREEYAWFIDYWFSIQNNCVELKLERIQANTKGLIEFTEQMCGNVLKQAPRFGCFGLHEWAMVYKLSPEELRHNQQKLRLNPNHLAQFVESQTLCCTHYDAFRFFTKEARPFNLLSPTLETRLEMEQAGCLHANMDLYKWAGKLWPFIGSDFIAKTFFLALKGRELDMRASPYDLKAEGYDPICIETEEGRKIYQKAQQELSLESNLLRQELQHFCQRLLEAIQKI